MISQNDIPQLFDTEVHESDGTKIGSTVQVYLDDQSGIPEWVTVRTGLFGLKESFVPLEGATLSDGRIEVPFTKDQVKNAPRMVEPDGSLTPAEEDELYAYYGLTSTGDLPSGTDSGIVAGTDPGIDPGIVADGRPEEIAKARMRRYVVTDQQGGVPVDRAPVAAEQTEFDHARRP